MTSNQRKKLSEIKQFKQLIAYLRDEMGWPINSDSEFDELTYKYTAAELGIDDKSAAQIQEIKRLRPLSAKQPWGVFFVKFEPKKLPVVALRRILGQVALKKRASANPADRTMWAQEDLLFISNYGEGDDRQITLAHFSVPSGGHTLPSLKVLGWDSKDTELHLEAVARELTEQLSWPDDETDVEAWRAKWRAAFTVGHREVITTSKALSIRLAQLARDIRDRISTALTIETADGSLTKLMKAFQESLINDLTPAEFADMYAQTIAYGLLSSRIADPKKKSVDDLAAHMRLSPFLKELMETFLQAGGRNKSTGLDFDELGVSEVVEVLDRSTMEAVVADFGDKNPQEDPVIHFYELFLKEYDAEKRMSRGVFYTPRPVVSFIVRSLDERLRTELKLQDGLADTTSWGEMAKKHKGMKVPKGVTPSQPFVQILDPATGTGTFLVEAIEVIHNTLVQKWRKQGESEQSIDILWNDYVPKHLLPRLHGFELLMAPYAIAHLKIGLKLHETKYSFSSDQRARVYLTNSLIEPNSDNQQLSYSLPALSREANAVNAIKVHGMFTVVMGNPPYARDSSNRGNFAEGLVERYKQRVRTEKNLQPLSDDYVKFIGLAQQIIETTGCGMIGYITNNSYLSGLIHRGMRAELLESFSSIQIYNLNGGVRDHHAIGDENVFAIQQGVAIGLFTKPSTITSQPNRMMYGSILGSRGEKFHELMSNNILTTSTVDILTGPPSYSFTRSVKDMDRAEYLEFTPVDEWFDFQIAGYKTHRDHIAINVNQTVLIQRLQDLASARNESDLRAQYEIEDNCDWKFASARDALQRINIEESVQLTSYRPFDDRWALWGPILMDRPRPGMAELLTTGNVALVCKRQNAIKPFSYALVVDKIFECCIFEGTHGNVMSFPLFAKHEGLFEAGMISNFRTAVVGKMQALSGLKYTAAIDTDDPSCFSARDLFAYLYALLHSSGYRLTYAEHLLQGFPRLPFVHDQTLFHVLVKIGNELIELHLAQDRSEAAVKPEFIGRPRIEKPRWENNRVLIDKSGLSSFTEVSQEVWDFQVGGYQVCEKWLKDRKGQDLSDSEILHFKNIVGVITLTIDRMGKIDKTIVEYGGWPDAFQAKSERS